MCPVGISTSRSTLVRETGQVKLWLLLVGVNKYQDERLPCLHYSAVDCQGLGEALAEAKLGFAHQEVRIHHDQASQLPQLQIVCDNLKQIVANAQPQDTVLFYFSGHGMLDPISQQAVLCLADTNKDNLLLTGLVLQEVLQLLGNCAAHQQLVWLDACHSGGMTLRGVKTQIAGESLLNPTPQFVEALQMSAQQSKGQKSKRFYALLSCDFGQQSWEFPELGHGLFTYYLMRGLRGEAADSQGVIEADGLYRYVYHQTLQYIDKTNQQLRLINQQRLGKGETQLHPEYPLQTPKRIVEGVGELVLGRKPDTDSSLHLRQALVVEGILGSKTTLELSKFLRSAGGFELEYWRPGKVGVGDIKKAISSKLQTPIFSREEPATVLLYLRGIIEETETGEAVLLVGENIRISRSWLRQQLRLSNIHQQILILDFPVATFRRLPSLSDWVEDLQLSSQQGQCIIAATSPAEDSERFTQALFDTLVAASGTTGLAVAGWITQLQVSLAGSGISLNVWLSGTQGVIEVLPVKTGLRGTELTAECDLGICPYMGLSAFEEADAQYFYGREALTQQLINQLTHHSFLAVVGASGSGKSSVVQAGLISQLRQGKQLPSSEQWWIKSFRPGARPLEALSRRLGGWKDGENLETNVSQTCISNQLVLEGMLYQGVEGFVYWVRSRPEPMIVLVIDQFEELFTLAPSEDRKHFLELILGAVEFAADKFKLVITVRADFIASCLEVPKLAILLQQSSVLVPPRLTKDDYRRIIIKPAQQVGLKVEPELIEVLLQELYGQGEEKASTAGDLPLLEFVLEQLWQNRSAGELTLQEYFQQIGGLKGALQRKAQAVYESLDACEKRCAQWIFLSLTQLGEGTEDTRRRIFKSDLVVAKYPMELVERTLQVLTAAKLIVVNWEEEETPKPQGRGEPSINEKLHTKSLKSTPLISLIKGGNVKNPLIKGRNFLAPLIKKRTVKILLIKGRNFFASLMKARTVKAPLNKRGWRDNSVTSITAQAIHQQDTEQLLLEKMKQAVTIEVAHEILIRHWSTLRWWLEENRARLSLQRQIRQASQMWLQSGQQTDFLLRGIRLAEAEELYIKYTDELSQDVQQFIEACLEERQQQQLQVKRRLRQQKAAIVSVSVLSLAAVSFSGLTYWQTRAAQLSNIESLNSSSEALLLSHQQLESLITSIKAGKKLKTQKQGLEKIFSLPLDTEVRTISTLSQAVELTQEINRLQGHTAAVNSVTFSPDNQLIASASDDNTVRLWRWDDTSFKTLTGHSKRVTSVAFSPDAMTIASASADKTIKLWRKDGTLIRTLTGHNDAVNSIRFSPDNKTLASASRDGTVKLWNLDDTLLKSFRTASGWGVNDVTFSPDGQTLATASNDKNIKLWNTKGTLLNTFKGHSDYATAIRFSPDGKILASASLDQTVRLWKRDGTLLKILNHNRSVNSISFSPDGKNLAVGSYDKTVTLWNLDGKKIRKIQAHGDSINSVNFSPDGKTLASASTDKTVKFWSTEDTRLRFNNEVHSVSFSPDGRTFAIAECDGTIQLLHRNSVASGLPVKTLKKHSQCINNISFSRDSKMLASGSDDKTIKLWNLADGTFKSLAGHQEAVTSVSFSWDGKMLASANVDKTIKLWNVANGVLLKTLKGHTARVNSVSFAPNIQILASGSNDKTLKLWDVDGSLIKTLGKHDREIAVVSFSPDGKIIASASLDGKIKLWDVSKGTESNTLTGHEAWVTDLSFSPDGKTLASSSNDWTLKLWNVGQGNLIKTFRGYDAHVLSVNFSPEGNALISSSRDKTVTLWNLDLDNLLKRGCERIKYSNSHSLLDTCS